MRYLEEEKAIWQAAYAAAFVEQFINNRVQVGFDRAVDLASAEHAIAVADLTVLRLREWRRDEKPNAGFEPV